MVSSGTVSGDASKISSIFSDYSSQISTLSSGIWEGNSKENAIQQMENFVDQFENVINTQMSNFESALDKYEDYKDAKEEKEQAENDRNREIENAKAADRPANTSSYDSKIESCDKKMKELKPEITKLLSEVKSAKLDIEATAIEPGSFSLGDFINYYQGDYGNVAFGDGSIANCGCGPTSMSMVLSYLTDENVDPVEAAKYCSSHGQYVPGAGTAWSYFDMISDDYGIECEQSASSVNKVVGDLEDDKTIIMSMGPGHFTSGGHYIVLRGLDSNGKVIVADPASRERSNVTWDPGLIVNESKQMWSFTGDKLNQFVI